MAGQFGDAKSTLRRQMRAVRESMPAGQHERESAAIGAAALAHPLVMTAQVVHSFIGTLPGEIDTRKLVHELLRRRKQVVCPRLLTDSKDLEHRRIASLNDLVKSDLGLWEPATSCPKIDVTKLDIVLVPGLAFDRLGGRLGMGGGYYDRFLEQSQAHANAAAIGLCFAQQLIDNIPLGPTDVAVDWIISRETIDCRKESGR